MDATEAWLSLGTVVLGALWTTGGHAALQRRAIQHELELAAQLENEELSAEMRHQAESRAVIYLARRQPAGGSERWVWARVAGLVLGLALSELGIWIGSTSPREIVDVLGASTTLLAYALVGGSLGSMADEMLRDSRAMLGKVRHRYAWRTLREARSRDGSN